MECARVKREAQLAEAFGVDDAENGHLSSWERNR